MQAVHYAGSEALVHLGWHTFTGLSTTFFAKFWKKTKKSEKYFIIIIYPQKSQSTSVTPLHDGVK